MRYKVVLFTNLSGGGNPDGQSTVTFYTRAQAEECASQWREIGSAHSALLWDGSSWTSYNPVP